MQDNIKKDEILLSDNYPTSSNIHAHLHFCSIKCLVVTLPSCDCSVWRREYQKTPVANVIQNIEKSYRRRQHILYGRESKVPKN